MVVIFLFVLLIFNSFCFLHCFILIGLSFNEVLWPGVCISVKLSSCMGVFLVFEIDFLRVCPWIRLSHYESV